MKTTCPVKRTVDLIGNKWKLLIIQQLIKQKCRYGELKKNIPAISSKVLTENLKMLEEDGLIIRTAYDEKVLRVEYQISEVGKLLLPLIDDMAVFGEAYMKYLEQD